MGKDRINDLEREWLNRGVVARERFELSSEAPEAPMLDHYTNGLRMFREDYHDST